MKSKKRAKTNVCVYVFGEGKFYRAKTVYFTLQRRGLDPSMILIQNYIGCMLLEQHLMSYKLSIV